MSLYWSVGPVGRRVPGGRPGSAGSGVCPWGLLGGVPSGARGGMVVGHRRVASLLPAPRLFAAGMRHGVPVERTEDFNPSSPGGHSQ